MQRTPPALARQRRGLTRRGAARQARDLDIDAKPRSDQATRFAFQKLTVEQTKARAGESLTRVLGNVADYSNKKYWTQAQNEVRCAALARSLGWAAHLPLRRADAHARPMRARQPRAPHPRRQLRAPRTLAAAHRRSDALHARRALASPLARSCAARLARCASTWTTWWRPRAPAPWRSTSWSRTCAPGAARALPAPQGLRRYLRRYLRSGAPPPAPRAAPALATPACMLTRRRSCFVLSRGAD